MRFETLASRYSGAIARNYDRTRNTSRKWAREQAAVEQFLAKLPEGASLIDVPSGTGRFFEYYLRYGVRANCVDISPDMLRLAAGRARQLGLEVRLRRGDIRQLDLPDNSHDVALSVRFLNWAGYEGLRGVIGELTRVSREYVVIGIRVYVPPAQLLSRDVAKLKRLGRQMWRRVKQRFLDRFRSKVKVIVYEKRHVLGLLAGHNLEMVSMTCIEASGNGTAYYIYVLRKKARVFRA